MYSVTSSYGVRLIGINKMLMTTIHIYQDAIAFISDAVNDMWSDVSAVCGSNNRMTYVERMIHDAGGRIAKYRFDDRFPNMPSYMRRDVIHQAIGNVSSYQANHDRWVRSGHIGKEPVLGRRTAKAPVFYRTNMYRNDNGDTAEIKLYDGRNWIWYSVKLRKQDVKYITRYWSHAEKSAPRLELKHGTARLVFAFTEQVLLSDEAKVAVGCDLGLNTDATLCAMRPDGTVFARKFINFVDEKGRLYHLMGIASKVQRKSGYGSTKRIWEYITLLNRLLADHIAKAITEFAASVNADVIVFEHLDMKGKKTKRQKIAMWRKNDIQRRVMHKAHRFGIRIVRVSAYNTSKLAFDGSGKVTRDDDNYSLCTFTTGKRYNCDLSASYNIAARYYMRMLEPLLATAESYVGAKVPGYMVRTLRTLATLINCLAALKEFASLDAETQLYGKS